MGFNPEDYEPVDKRIKRFYADHEDGRILTELLTCPDNLDSPVMRAEIWIGDTLKASGVAFEKPGDGANRTSHLENCETSAIGRGLANAGYSGDKRASREEMQKTQATPDGAAMLAKLYAVTTKALIDGDMNVQQFANMAKGLDPFLAKHPEKNVGDYTKQFEARLKEKRAEKSSKGKTTTEPAQPSEKGKAEIAETVARMAGKAAEQEELIPEEDIF